MKNLILKVSAWFSYVRKIPDDRGVYCFPTVPVKTRNCRYPRSSGMDGDKSGESGAFLFSRRVPDFAHYQSPKLLGSSLPITQVSSFGALSISGQIHRENQRENCANWPILLGRSAKSKSPDRLGFSRHMKTRLRSDVYGKRPTSDFS